MVSHSRFLLFALLLVSSCAVGKDEAPPPGGGPTDGDGGIGFDTGNPDVGAPCVPKDPNVDADKDGFTPAQGDCNDCNALVNPGAFDYPGNGIDEDCSGVPDDEPGDCDKGLPLEGDDAEDAARSLGICRKQTGESWGLVSAKWMFPDGTTKSVKSKVDSSCSTMEKWIGTPPSALSRGLLPTFGKVVRPRSGQSMVAISSGIAREGAFLSETHGYSPYRAQMCTASSTPEGFPIDSPACKVTTKADTMANDGIALELVIRVPTNARSFSFDFDFFTYEWPGYVCDVYNDFFVALLTSKSKTTPANKNISFDSEGNPVSVNNALLRVCPGPADVGVFGKKHFDCPLGIAELEGTGFDGNPILDLSKHAATSWLQTRAEVVPGETITLRFAVWDTHDEQLDSTTLIDSFAWAVEPAGPPVTKPVIK